MAQYIKERDLYPAVVSSDRFRDNVFFHEVPTADWTEDGKRIDLVTTERGKIVAIELKVSKWREALHQAFRNLFISDLSYVAIFHRHVKKLDRSLFEDCGIGLIELNGTANIVLEARESRLVIPQKRDYLLSQCTPSRVYQQ